MDIITILIIACVAAWFLTVRERRKEKASTEMDPVKWFQTSTTDPATGDRITRFEAPNPATADMMTIRAFVDNELFLPKLERYLEIAKESNASAEVISLIENHIKWLCRFDKE